MSYSKKLEDRIDHFFIKNELIAKNKEMGGVGWLVNGNMCSGIYENLFVVRANPKIVDKLIQEPDITLFIHQKEKKDTFLSVTEKIYKDDKALHKFLNHSAKYTSTLPPKEHASR